MRSWVDWKIVAFGFIMMIVGFSFGVEWELPKIGDVFALLGAVLGVMGAYEIATRTERQEKAAKLERIRYLYSTFSQCLFHSYDRLPEKRPVKIYMSTAKKCLGRLESMPADQIPGDLIGFYEMYVESARNIFSVMERAVEIRDRKEFQKFEDIRNIRDKWMKTFNEQMSNFKKAQTEFEKKFL